MLRIRLYMTRPQVSLGVMPRPKHRERKDEVMDSVASERHVAGVYHRA
jgi:hypothetical protein